ncbi:MULTISPECIES: glycine cleavage system protein GcvH [Actinosynnema]|uniref:Glycine cleavage system H protein n=3 Tax=Actinosynnema TaxID=40566 RepID=C6WIX5_ACTMD|nr:MULTISPECIES: glycine cleavage system protein GcvH [Actinosynnema]AXX33577.1 Glycine cleavage system H protein [Actinosynnema pretiosum subsp. pretiosum]ACU40051.1 glycine cleavage system H protein [Actinosynnema mirum DSM 43827]ATE57133.1 glycine cleavage system protein H [Actinosynnema pretiosum]MCP2097957.1 glycine cleavage system H protein [Actinosynnema pretiosum]QUF02629.1 glycine cleavage system protein GcvH [Actinosynnema pretiosum subsp. pretiosum]
MPAFPENLLYTADHEWVDWTPGTQEPVSVGITSYAAESLGDIVFVQLPEVGERVTSGQVCGELESTKSVSDLYAPVSGEVVEVNTGAVEDPALVNGDPYGGGWLFKVRVESAEGLLTAAKYAELTGD